MKLSVPHGTVLVMSARPNPWAYFATHHPGTEAHHDLSVPGLWGLTEFEPVPRIRLHHRLTQVERRVTIRHECFHLERGPIPKGGAGREEKIVRDLTARWLLPDLDDIKAALSVSDLHTAADDLWVTFAVLVDRLNGLTDQESAHVHG